jgi:hypothetical protein
MKGRDMRKLPSIPPELRARIDGLNDAMGRFNEAVMTAVLRAADDCAIDPDFAFEHAGHWLLEEAAKVRKCAMCNAKRRKCRGCQRRVACLCRETAGLCSQCDEIVRRLVKKRLIVSFMLRVEFGE